MISAPKMPPIAHIRTTTQVIAISSPSKNFTAISTITPRTAFIARLVAVFRVLYSKIATISATINTEISAIQTIINIYKSATYL